MGCSREAGHTMAQAPHCTFHRSITCKSQLKWVQLLRNSDLIVSNIVWRVESNSECRSAVYVNNARCFTPAPCATMVQWCSNALLRSEVCAEFTKLHCAWAICCSLHNLTKIKRATSKWFTWWTASIGITPILARVERTPMHLPLCSRLQHLLHDYFMSHHHAFRAF